MSEQIVRVVGVVFFVCVLVVCTVLERGRKDGGGPWA